MSARRPLPGTDRTAIIGISDTPGETVARTARKKRATPARRGPGRPSRGWTRTNIRIDRAKLTAAQRILGLPTATETVDAALDAVTLREELLQGLDLLREAGGLTSDSED